MMGLEAEISGYILDLLIIFIEFIIVKYLDIVLSFL